MSEELLADTTPAALLLADAALPPLLLELCSLSITFGDRPVLKDFSCSIAAGETVCIVGPSGRGKTTLLRILMSLEEPDSGIIKWHGYPRVSAVFQEDRLCANLNALANCLLVVEDDFGLSAGSEPSGSESEGDPKLVGGSLLLDDPRDSAPKPAGGSKACRQRRRATGEKQRTKSQKREHVLRIITALGLAGHEHRPVKELSGGQQRRVALARALASRYDLLILDEPFKGLDPETKDAVLLYTRSSTAGKTVLLVTHDEYEAKALGARVISL